MTFYQIPYTSTTSENQNGAYDVPVRVRFPAPDPFILKALQKGLKKLYLKLSLKTSHKSPLFY